MSMCICLTAPNGNLLISGDSRVGAYDESGILKRTGENIEKVRLLSKDKAIFLSGVRSTMENIVSDFQRIGMTNPSELASILQWHTAQIPTEVLEARKHTKLQTGILYICLENDNIQPYVICNVLKDNNGSCIPYPFSFKEDGKGEATFGATDNVLAYFKELRSNVKTTDELIRAICKTYDFASNEAIGGILTIYEFSPIDGAIKKYNYSIVDNEFLDLGNIILNGAKGDIELTGNIYLGEGNITWGNNAPVKYQFSVDGVSSWHTTMQNIDRYRRDSLDGGITWGNSYQFKGIDGRDGSDGSDANIPDYITSTKITKTTIESPKITGGLIEGGEFRAIGNLASTYSGISEVGIYATPDNKFGFIRYDNNGEGTPEEAEERMFICTEDGKAMKIQSGGNLSIDAGGKDKDGTIYFGSNVVFGKNPQGVVAVFGG